MSYKNKISAILLISVILIGLIQINRFFNSIGEFVYLFAISIGATSFVMFFSKEDIFNIWKKFTIIYVFVSILIIIFSPAGDGFIPFGYRDFFSYYLPISLFTTSIFMTIKYTYKWNLAAIILLGHVGGMIIWYIIAVIM